ncbi:MULTISPECIES: oligopeptide ABC transporter substrate-binding protein [Pontibacillus]|uniref:ABC transporter substrate-binding protein n=1 Tax=Pontibacillus chungwhensis TaxID=265426 RepID=A0ABY8UYN3_9BACI|nr:MULTISPECIES: oligopeptide ABC transporter substrate-binding protein [Pontibacillus]WIF98781.1 ABC transporter substrate-binding protein [Pontibacillus chungwhensis]
MSLMLMLTLFLAACNSDANGDSDDSGDDTEDTSENTDSEGDSGEDASGEPQEGGTLNYAIDSEPEGILSPNFYGSATDFEVIQFGIDPLFEYDENLQIEPNLADWSTEDNKVFTFTFEEGVKWHNGDELTVEDWVFALETLADPDYTGPRYANVQTIEGAEAYHSGDADSISGIEVVSDYEVKVTFDKARVNNLLNVWSYPMNRSYWEGVEVADMQDSDKMRQGMMGTGPFKLTKVVPGESYQYEANEDYWKGAPKLDKVIVKVIDSKSVIGALENGDVDMVPVHPTLGKQVEEMENVDLRTYPGLSYYYLGFKFGKFDNEKKEVVEKNDKYADLKLRKAMYHAINRDEWIEAFFSGYGSKVNAPVPTNHWIAADQSELNDYAYDTEKAKSLLDEAGYKDVNDDGFREDPNGDEFVINLAHYASTNPTFESRAKALTQYWEEVGLKAELQMIESSLYYDKVEKDAEGIEVFFGGWSTGSDPDPSALWKSDQLWNYTRWVNEESDQLLDDALDIDKVGTDQEKRKEKYVEWQKLLNEQLPMLYIAELEEIYGVNKRVGGVEFDVSGSNSPHLWYIQN